MKTFFLILISLTIISCSSENIPAPAIENKACLEPSIPCPVLIGDKNEACVANIIFLAEGFTENEIPEFRNLCKKAKQAILEIEPFTSYSTSLNFYRVDSKSMTSGIKTIKYTSECNGTTGTDTYSETPWEVFNNKIGLSRLVGMESSKRDRHERLYGSFATGDYAYTIIIANTSGFYGGAEFPGVTEYNTIKNPKVSNMIISKFDSGELFKYLIRHEFGHSFGNMDDEYVDLASKCALKEQAWFLPHTPKANLLTYNPGSWFEGARYVPNGYWREWRNSIMRDDYKANEYSPTQTKVLKKRLMNAIGCP